MPSEREDRLERMRRYPDRLARLVEGQSIERLRRAGAGGEWGAVEILAHLRDFDEVTLDRVRRILSDEEPYIPVFDADLMALEHDYHAQNPFEVLASFRSLRGRLVSRLSRLDEAQWQRAARHERLGRITLDDLIRHVDEHDHHHLRSLKDVLL